MALKWLRDQFKHLKIILWGVVAVFVLLVFVDWGAGRSGGRGSRDMAVQIGDRVVSEQEFLEELRRMNQRFQQLYGDRWSELRDQVDLAGQTVAFFIDRELRLAEAAETGLVVSSKELQEQILSNPMFQDEAGAFIGPERYQRAIRSYFRMTPQEFERRYAEDILVAKLDAVVRDGTYVTDKEVERQYRRETEVADFDVVQLRYEPYLGGVTVEEPELIALFESAQEEYRRPEQRVIRYLVVETSRLRRLLPADDSDLQQYYEDHREEFVEEEQANARHILLRLPPGAPPVGRAEVEQRARSVAEIARSGADFAELAAKHSEDPGSKDNGGDLGWFGRGQMVKEFEDAVWDAKPGEVIGPVESQFGFHVIRVEGFKPQRQRPFEEVREGVRYRYLEGRAAAEAELRATELARRLEADPPQTDEAWQQIADEDEAVVLNVSPPFERGGAIPGTGSGRELGEEAFDARVGAVGNPLPIPRGWMVWQLSEIRPEGVPAFEDVRAEVEQRLRRQKALEVASERAAVLADRWRAGDDVEELAAEFDGTVIPVQEHRWGGGIGNIGGALAVDEAVFGAREGDVLGPIELATRGVAIVAVRRLELMDQEEFESQQEQVRLRLVAERAQQLLQSILNERRRDTLVTVNNELVERFAPTS
jgi:peptidyl-prolyl cis-trans isomerase D